MISRVEVLRCRRLVKGYSDTHARGLSKFDRVMAKAPKLVSARGRRAMDGAPHRGGAHGRIRRGARRRREDDRHVVESKPDQLGPFRSFDPLTARRRRAKDGRLWWGRTWSKRPGGLEFRLVGPRAPRTGSAQRSASAAGSGSPSVTASSMKSTIHVLTRLASATSGSSSPTGTLSSPRSSATARRSSNVSKTGFPLSA